MKRDRNGKGAALAEEVPPPPPPRKPASNGFNRGAAPSPPSVSSAPSFTAVAGASRANGVRAGGGGGRGRGRGGVEGGGARPAGAARPTGTTSSSSSSSSTSAAAKKKKLGLGRLEGWRAAADEILARAGGGTGGDAGSGLQGKGAPAQLGTRGGDAAARPASRRKFAAVCSANFNRSMMAHKLLQEHRFFVKSYGTGRDVRLPGKDASTPEVFPFGTPYRDIFDSLRRKDEDFFLRNNLLPLVARNATIKAAPQRFQEIEGPDMAGFDVVLCFDSRVFYLVVEGISPCNDTKWSVLPRQLVKSSQNRLCFYFLFLSDGALYTTKHLFIPRHSRLFRHNDGSAAEGFQLTGVRSRWRGGSCGRLPLAIPSGLPSNLPVSRNCYHHSDGSHAFNASGRKAAPIYTYVQLLWRCFFLQPLATYMPYLF